MDLDKALATEENLPSRPVHGPEDDSEPMKPNGLAEDEFGEDFGELDDWDDDEDKMGN